MNIDIEKEVDGARYSDDLAVVIASLSGASRILRKEYESDYQGFVDIDVLLNDGKVFSYYYSYGSCSGCDEWESKDFSDGQVQAEMLAEATIFDNIEQYERWRGMVKKRDEERVKEFEWKMEAQRKAERKYHESLQKMFKQGDLEDIGQYMRENQKDHYYGS